MFPLTCTHKLFAKLIGFGTISVNRILLSLKALNSLP